MFKSTKPAVQTAPVPDLFLFEKPKLHFDPKGTYNLSQLATVVFADHDNIPDSETRNAIVQKAILKLGGTLCYGSRSCFTGDVAAKYVVAIRDSLNTPAFAPDVVDTVPDTLSEIDTSDFLMP